MQEFFLTNNLKHVSLHNVPQLFSTAFAKSMSLENITSGFRKTGLFPICSTVFSETDFAGSDLLSNRPLTTPAIDDEVGESSSAAIPETDLSKICPMPTGHGEISKRRREPGRSRVLTDSPEKKSLKSDAQFPKRGS